MLLLWTCKDDKTVDWFVSKYLDGSGIRWRRFNTENFPEHAQVISTPTNCDLVFGNETLPFKEVTAVWYRRPSPSIFQEITMNDDVLFFIQEEAERALCLVQDALKHARWMNWPENNKKSSGKIRQLQMAEKHGLRCPKTVITNDIDIVLDLASQHNGHVIVKPLRVGSVTVENKRRVFYSTILDINQLSRMRESIKICPHIFQEPIPKLFELRIIVVGQYCLAFKLHSQEQAATSIDWRRMATVIKHEPFSLPDAIASQCIEIVRECDLFFSAFDMIVTPEEEYVFLEHNPNGQFAWLEEKTGVPIGAAIRDILIKSK